MLRLTVSMNTGNRKVVEELSRHECLTGPFETGAVSSRWLTDDGDSEMWNFTELVFISIDWNKGEEMGNEIVDKENRELARKERDDRVWGEKIRLPVRLTEWITDRSWLQREAEACRIERLGRLRGWLRSQSLFPEGHSNLILLMTFHIAVNIYVTSVITVCCF